jgi:hypothetical protein
MARVMLTTEPVWGVFEKMPDAAFVCYLIEQITRFRVCSSLEQ